MKIVAPAGRMGRTVASAAFVLLFLALAGTAFAAPSDSAQRDLVNRTIAGHEKNLALQRSRLQEAEALRKKQEFRKALALVEQVKLDCSIGRTHCSDEQARRYAVVRDEAMAERELINREFGRVTLRNARELASAGKYENAISRADEAGKIDPALLSQVAEFKTYCQAKIKDRDFSNATNVSNFQPGYKSTQEQIDKLYREASVLFDKGRYTEAIKKLEEIYVLDPLNTRATHLLELTYRKVYTAVTQRQVAEARGIAAHGSWVWVEPQQMTGPSVQRHAEVKVEGNEVQRRMDDIILPEVELADNTDISSALSYLQQLAWKNDAKKDVDNGIIFMFSNGGEAAAAAPAKSEGGESEKASEEESTASAVPRVSEMKFTNISLSDALRYLCMETGLRYRIDGNTIIVGRNIEVTRDASFAVPRALINSILGNDSGSSSSSGDAKTSKSEAFGAADEGGASQSSVATSASSEKLKVYFSKRGISFGDNAKINYNSRTGKLLVSNTPDNLRRLDELLRQLSVISTPMVMTEIKVIQIQEGDMEELSFYWALTVDHENGGSHAWTAGVNTGTVVRKSTDVINTFPTDTSLISNLSIFPGIIDSAANNLKVSVNALSQHSNTETIQAPRLISESGHRAWIKMVTKTRFPDSWDAPSIETNGDATSIQMPLPELGEYTEYGTKLEVTPSVMADNYTIQLHLYTEIKDVVTGPENQGVSEASYSNLDNVYGVQIDRGYLSETGERVSYTDYPVTYWVWLPEFVTHSLDVQLKVFDGQTIVMGGVTTSKTTRMEDRTPLLSDIPLLGRLFTAKAEDNEKVTLLFFVTARLIDSYGRPLNTTVEDRGIPQFN